MNEDDPFLNLWTAVLLQAVIDYVSNKGRTLVGDRRRFFSAQWWLFEDTSGRSNSFVALCDILALDPEKIRQGARRLSAAELRQLKLHNDRRRHAEGGDHQCIECGSTDHTLDGDANDDVGSEEYPGAVPAAAGGVLDLLAAAAG